MKPIPHKRISHWFNLPLLAAAALTVFGAASSHGDVLGVPGATQVEYTFGENGYGWVENFQNDASGNGRIMTGVDRSQGTWDGGPLCNGSTHGWVIENDSAYGMSNTDGMATDFQVSIFLAASGKWPTVGDNGSGTAIYHIGDLSLQADGHPDGGMTYYASVAGTQIGTYTATTEWQPTGLMVQKLNNVFSYWVSTNYGTSWSQRGPDFSAPSANVNFSGTHLFVRPGGGYHYWGPADDFKVVAVTAPVANNPFLGWINTGWPDLADKDPNGDPDHDGIPNLLEYMLYHGDPAVSSTAILPAVTDASGADMVFTCYRRNASTADTIQVFQYGSNLTNDWADVGLTPGATVAITPNTPDTGIDKIVITVPKLGKGTLFGRLKVSKL